MMYGNRQSYQHGAVLSSESSKLMRTTPYTARGSFCEICDLKVYKMWLFTDWKLTGVKLTADNTKETNRVSWKTRLASSH